MNNLLMIAIVIVGLSNFAAAEENEAYDKNCMSKEILPWLRSSSAYDPEAEPELLKMLEKCIAAGGNVNFSDSEALRLATTRQLTKAMRLLIKNEADVNVGHHFSNAPITSPLYGAVYDENIDAVKILLEAKAKTEDDRGTSILDVYTTPEIAILLLEKGANVCGLNHDRINDYYFYLKAKYTKSGTPLTSLNKYLKPYITKAAYENKAKECEAAKPTRYEAEDEDEGAAQ